MVGDGGCASMVCLAHWLHDTPAIQSWHSAGFPAGANTHSSSAITDLAGLSANHAYAILELFVTPVNGERLVRLRDMRPAARRLGGGTGVSLWKGAWRDGGPEWDSEPGLHEACNPWHSESDNVFWMALRDFLRCFQSMQSAKLHDPPWSVVRVRVPLPRERSGATADAVPVFALRIVVPQTADVDVAVSGQPSIAGRGLGEAAPFVRNKERFSRDLGVAVVKEGQDWGAAAGDGGAPPAVRLQSALGMRYVMGARRRVAQLVSCEGILDGLGGGDDGVYWVLPITLNGGCDGAGGAGCGRAGSDGDFVVVEVYSSHAIAADLVAVSLTIGARGNIHASFAFTDPSLASSGTPTGCAGYSSVRLFMKASLPQTVLSSCTSPLACASR